MAEEKWSTPLPMESGLPMASMPHSRHSRKESRMPDLSIDFCGVHSPNPFWLASGPPTNTAYQVMKAFDAGWGGAVWKTIGDPIINTASRYGSIDYKHERMIGLNNIELISDRSIETNFREIAEVKKRFPKNTVVASLMVESKRETWHEIMRRAQDSGADLVELNFGCPHGMSERGMGAAVGQVPDYTTMITTWVKEVATIPVIVKLTPNVTDVAHMAYAAKQGGADAVSLVNTFNSLVGVDLDSLAPRPNVGGYGSHGGYCGPSVKPIALHMVSSVAKHPKVNIPISGIGGIANWQDAAEFIALGATSVQVCTAAMHYGFRIVEDMLDGLAQYLDDKGFNSVMDLVGKSVERIRDWGDLDLNYKIVARIDPELCIGDRKSTRLNSSHLVISYAVFCLKQKTLIPGRRPRYARQAATNFPGQAALASTGPRRTRQTRITTTPWSGTIS